MEEEGRKSAECAAANDCPQDQETVGAVVDQKPDCLKAEDEIDEHKVVAECPCCRKKMRLRDRNVLYIVEQPVIMGPDSKGHPGVPRMVCMNCGSVFLPRDMRIHIFNQLTGLGNKIIVPRPVATVPDLKLV